MTWTDVFNSLGNAFLFAFKGLKALGNFPNIILWIIIAGLLVRWTYELSKYAKEAKKNGTIAD